MQFCFSNECSGDVFVAEDCGSVIAKSVDADDRYFLVFDGDAGLRVQSVDFGEWDDYHGGGGVLAICY